MKIMQSPRLRVYRITARSGIRGDEGGFGIFEKNSGRILGCAGLTGSTELISIAILVIGFEAVHGQRNCNNGRTPSGNVALLSSV